jgi:hypothetical protein
MVAARRLDNNSPRIGVGSRLDSAPSRIEAPAPAARVEAPAPTPVATADTAVRDRADAMPLPQHSTAAEGIATNARNETNDVDLKKAKHLYVPQPIVVRADGEEGAAKMPHNKGKLHYEGRGGDLKLDEGMDADSMLKSNKINLTTVPANMSKAEADAIKQAVVALVVTNDMIGYEADVKIQVNGKMRFATIQVDQNKNATATLHPDAPTAKALDKAAEGKSKTEWKNKLEKDFGVKLEERGGRSWTSTDLKEMHAAFSLMSKDERAALQGLRVVRSDQIKLSTEEAAHSHRKDPAGLYRGASTREGKNNASIEIDDDAYKGNKSRFVGDENKQWRSSTQTVLHEVGHAVADRRRLEARMEYDAAFTALANSNGKYQAQKLDITMKQYALKPEAVDNFLAKADRVDNLLSLRGQDGLNGKEKTKYDKQLTAAIKERDAAFGKMSTEDQGRMQPLRDTQTKHQSNITRLEKAEAANTKHGSENTDRLKAFYAAVDPKGTKNDIQPFTDYASASWKEGHKDEFFAEAFALYKLDPKFVEKNYKAVFDFFEAGGHVK